jgi:hypothetical protein
MYHRINQFKLNGYKRRKFRALAWRTTTEYNPGKWKGGRGKLT